MKRRKRIGERTDPCGTPLDTPKVADVAPSTTTDIKRSGKKLQSQLIDNNHAGILQRLLSLIS